MPAHCKQVATDCRETDTTATDVHGGHELPGIGLGVVSGKRGGKALLFWTLERMYIHKQQLQIKHTLTVTWYSTN